MAKRPGTELMKRYNFKYLVYRDPEAIERDVGKKRKAQQVGTSFFDWPLWQRYPSRVQFDEQLAAEREAAEKAGRPAHLAAAAPLRGPSTPMTYRSALHSVFKGPKGSK